MQQPKFKFGDIVQGVGDRGEKVIFEITDIKKYPDNFAYSNSSIDGYFDEKDIELYQEAQKKKLYAYWVELKVFHDHDFGIQLIGFHPNEEYCKHSPHMRRAPEYDIEYPESE